MYLSLNPIANMSTLIKTTERYRKSEPQFDLEAEVIRCFERLDIEGLTKLVLQEDIFDETMKYRLLDRYNKVFTYIREVQGINELKSRKTNCNGCEPGREVISFVNHLGFAHFGIYFEKENGVIIEVGQCSDFNGYFRSLIESQSTKYATPITLD